MPGPQDVHIDIALSDLSVGYQPQNMIAEKIAPIVPVEKQSNKYFILPTTLFNVEDDTRAPGTAPREIDWVPTNDLYFADGHALRHRIPYEDMTNADAALRLEEEGTLLITELSRLNQENMLATKLTATGTYASGFSGAPSTTWDVSSSTPITDVRNAKNKIQKAIGLPPNVMVLGKEVFDKLIDHPTIVDRAKYTWGNQVTGEFTVTSRMLAGIFGIEEVLIGEAVKNTANRGQTASNAYLWGKNAILMRRSPSVGLKTLTFALHFFWAINNPYTRGMDLSQERLAQGFGATAVEKWDDRNTKSEILDINRYYDQKVVVQQAGYLINAAIA